MLQRAASNAYSWWWASHVRTKQSKWLEQNLHDMEEKVNIALRIIDHGGDSFAQRAEMYYRKRPEIISFVEDSFRAYRALAERYDHLSRELQSANRTIATVFPERAQYAMEVDDPEENHHFPQEFDEASDSVEANKQRIPKVPKLPSKELRSPSVLSSRKGSSLRKIDKAATTIAASVGVSSGLTKNEAVEEIDKLQKGILALQTEKEFVKSMYEHGYKKFWELKNEINEMHKKVRFLQEEFGVGLVIEDDEARTLMAETALKSCQETLAKIQKKQEQSAEEARIEQQRIMEAHEKFESLRAKFMAHEAGTTCMEEDDESMGSEEVDVEMLRARIKAQFDVGSDSSLTVTELAEKIDELVNKVVSLETAVSSQTTLVKRMSSETDQLQANVRSLEEDKETLKEGSDIMNKKLKELEEELFKVKNLNQGFKVQNNNFQKNFTEASCSLDHLSSKLRSVKHNDETDNVELSHEVSEVSEEKQEENIKENINKMVTGDGDSFVSRDIEETIKENESILVLEDHAKIEKKNQSNPSESDTGLANDNPKEFEVEKEENSKPSLRQLFLKGLEDREKVLLEEYTSVLQDYKEVKKKLSEVENKNRDSIFELAMQIRELKGHIATKDNEIKSLKHNVDIPRMNPEESPISHTTEYKYSNQHIKGESSAQVTASPGSEAPSLHLWRDSVSEIGEANPESLTIHIDLQDGLKRTIGKETAKIRPFSTIEEKFRSDIDGLLEENLEFWLRFSTSVHQIQKFETSIEDLHLELRKLREHNNKKSDIIGTLQQHSIQSDTRPIYRHLREIQTEMSLWFEHNAVLKDELQGRFSSLCHIQNEISRVSGGSSKARKTDLSAYQAAKFQGEVLNMKQENNKVADELRVGLNRVRVLKLEVEKTLARLNEELGISAAMKSFAKNAMPVQTQRPRIPLRSFLFGVKLKRQKPSIFSCVSPALQKQYSDLAATKPLPS